jgi:LacI family transcriptional regulator
MMAYTLEDIAEKSGYSRSTVSRVINGEPGVSKKARQQINKVIKELNFHPNQAARALATGKINTIGLLIPETVKFIFTDPYFQLLAQGISKACEDNGYALLLWLAEPEIERSSIKKYLNHGIVDGFITASINFDEPMIDTLLESNLPFAIIGRHAYEFDLNYVDLDNLAGAEIATQHLVDQGYKRIATITGPQDMFVGEGRLTGYFNVLHANGLVIDDDLIMWGNFSQESGYTCAKKLLEHKPDAIFAASDVMAVGAMQAIHDAGLRIPEDIAVIGFDDLPLAAQQNPPLTTIRQPIKEMGYMAVKTLLKAMDNPDGEVFQTIIRPNLVVRQST